MKLFLLGTGLFFATSSLALAGETWTGTGEMYDAQRHLVSTYTLQVDKEATGERTERITIEVKADGRVVYQDVCDVQKGENRWTKTCRDGKAGGYVFANGLMQEYTDLGNGHAYATTMIDDSSVKKRILRTELQGMEAVRFYSEVLEKTGN